MNKKLINLKGIKQILNDPELKNIMGGSGVFSVCSVLCYGICWTQAGGDGYCKVFSDGKCDCVA